MLTYNQISDECFNFCISSFNRREMNSNEVSLHDLRVVS